jgi:transposase
MVDLVVVPIKRTDFTAAELRAAAAYADDTRVTRRALAIAMVLDGYPRAAAAELSGMDRQALRDWVHRFNAEGLEGLSDRPRPGRPACLSAEQMQQVEAWVEAGPDLETEGIVRWRRVDLMERIKAKFSVTLDVRSVGRLLRALNFRRISVRPQHPQSDEAAQRAFQTDFSELAVAAIPKQVQGRPVEIWWQDEARVGQQGTLTRIWARRGTRPRAMRDHRFTSAYLFGAVCPDRGTGAAVIMPYVNTEAMNVHLAEISRCVSVGAIALLILDGASWHISPKLKIPDNIALLPLPPYAPELNPVENIWAFLRGNILSHRIYEDYEAVIQACADAWNKLMKLPETIASIATRHWAQVKT